MNDPDDFVNNMKYKISSVWWEKNHFTIEKEKISYRKKALNEKNTNRFIEALVSEIKEFPEEDIKRQNWKERNSKLLFKFIEDTDLISTSDLKFLLDSKMLSSTEEFLKRAKEFDDLIKIEDIGQAIRNVWIMNIIQILLDKEPELSNSVFAYSMLYPYTDNFLDDTNNDLKEKNQINHRFKERLQGKKLETNNTYEKQLFSLIECIENQYNRDKYPMVYKSLIWIHEAQMNSLKQQDIKSGPYEQDILGISIEKGGTSVVADACLVQGDLSIQEALFFFGYGVMLQLCDDLQDIEEDLKNSHMTITSQLAGKWKLDNLTDSIIDFIDKNLEMADCFTTNKLEEIKELIRNNARMLIIFSLAKNKKYYSKEYYKKMRNYFPFRERYMKKFYKKLKKKYSDIKESYGGLSTEKIILYLLS